MSNTRCSIMCVLYFRVINVLFTVSCNTLPFSSKLHQLANYTDYTDEELVPLLKTGHPEAFTCIYERHWHALYQTAYRRLADREQCSDIVQDVFIDLWEQRGNKTIQRLEPYLHT